MKPASPAATTAAWARNLAGSVEGRVRDARTFFRIVEQNTPQIFLQLEKIEFS
jgi:hypothetical protein